MTSDRVTPIKEKVTYLLQPSSLHKPSELAHKPSLVPDVPGVYGWYFDRLPPGLPSAEYFGIYGWMLLYVGISNNLRRRLTTMHMGDSEDVSTLHASLAALMPEEQVPQWLVAHGRVAFVVDGLPTEIEAAILRQYGRLLPLNLKGNVDNPIAEKLKALRKKRRTEKS